MRRGLPSRQHCRWGTGTSTPPLPTSTRSRSAKASPTLTSTARRFSSRRKSGSPTTDTTKRSNSFDKSAGKLIAAQVPSASLVKVYTEDDDPNKLLGRPNGYTSKIAFADSRISKADTDGTDKDAIERGGSIEVFPDAELPKGRAQYIQGVLKNSGLGAEYDYLRGPVLVRVTGNFSPSKAQAYERALG
jgi:hypothetical protein